MDELLKKIDDVRNRTNVDYADAKIALDNCNGDVLEAVIYIEQKKQMTIKKDNLKSSASNMASDIIDKLKELIKKGNIVRILVKKNNSVIMNIPVTAGIVGVIAFTTVSILSIGAAIATGCRIYVVNKDNTIFEVRKLLEGTAINVKNTVKVVSSSISKSVAKKDESIELDLDDEQMKEIDDWLDNKPTFTKVIDSQNESDDKIKN